jgi:hypothetical protein
MSFNWITFLKPFVLPGLLGLAWVVYALWGLKWLRGVRRARLF